MSFSSQWATESHQSSLGRFLTLARFRGMAASADLNVLASRARERCVVFSSITAADIPVDSAIRGTRMLRALLSFAETGKLGSGTLTGGGFDSPFEEAVARAVREAGFHAHSQVGVAGFRIDLGVVDPSRPGQYILGIECDGAAYHSARSARDRDRLRQEVLEGMDGGCTAFGALIGSEIRRAKPKSSWPL
jgi:hypothetical protein